MVFTGHLKTLHPILLTEMTQILLRTNYTFDFHKKEKHNEKFIECMFVLKYASTALFISIFQLHEINFRLFSSDPIIDDLQQRVEQIPFKIINFT